MSGYFVFASVSIALLISTMSSTAVSVAFPQIASTFDVSILLAGWVLSISQLATTVVAPIAGGVSDVYGRKRTFMYSVLLFSIGTLLCAIAPNIYLLISFRLIQGIGTGCFIAASFGIVGESFPERRQAAIGLTSSIFTAGMVIGPNVGGWLTESFGWRSIFWFTIPWGVAALVATGVFIGPDGERRKVNLDVRGSVLFAASLSTIMLSITSFGSNGTNLSWATPAAMIGLGIALMVMFLRHERRAASPLIDIGVLSGKPFAAANAFNLLYGFATGVLTLVPLYAVTIYSMSTIESGLIITPRSVGMVIGSIVSSFFLVRWGYRRPMVYGASAVVLALVLLGFEWPGARALGIELSGAALMVIAMAVAGLGHGFAVPAANNACIELMPDRLSTISGVRLTFRNCGIALGISMATVILESSGSLARGFALVLFGAALAVSIGIPCIFAMPRSPLDIPPGWAPERSVKRAT